MGWVTCRRWGVAVVVAVGYLLGLGGRVRGKEFGDLRSLLLDAATEPGPVAGEAGGGFEGNLTGDWGGVRGRLQEAGVTVGAVLTAEGFENFRGGKDTAHAVGATTFDLNVSLDMDKLMQWKGGKFYMDVEDHAFRNPTTALVGDLQVFDKTNASPYLEVFEMWYEQKLWDDKLRVKVGKVDGNTEFSVIDYGAPFLSSSAQLSPTLFTLPTTPDPMPSADVFWTPSDWVFASAGVSYSNRRERFGDIVGDVSRIQGTDDGAFFIGETGLKWHEDPVLKRAGNVKVGVWDHTGKFTRFDGTEKRGAFGYYAIFDQTLWQPAGEKEDGRGVRGFLEYGGTEESVNVIDRHIGGGLAWTGMWSGRPRDVMGVSPQYGHVSSEAGLEYPYELAVEGFYQAQVTPWAVVQPDLQYIVHPGGVHGDALVFTLRVQVSF